ncbi:MAG: helix-turn-helix domain-containing protein [Thermodesulfobacteriota bacterium]|jgi:predicted DNA-binding transcriptional regulator AlpA
MESKIEYLTEKEVSRICKLALSTLRNYRHQGKPPSYVKVGRAVRYLMSDIVKFMEEGRIRNGE